MWNEVCNVGNAVTGILKVWMDRTVGGVGERPLLCGTVTALYNCYWSEVRVAEPLRAGGW